MMHEKAMVAPTVLSENHIRTYWNGDPKPFAEIYSHGENVTYMGAEGTCRVGWEATYADWKAQADKSTGGEVHGADIHIIVHGDMAVAQHLT